MDIDKELKRFEDAYKREFEIIDCLNLVKGLNVLDKIANIRAKVGKLTQAEQGEKVDLSI